MAQRILFVLNREAMRRRVVVTFADSREFLVALKQKAGLAADFWSPDMNVSHYAVTKWTERDFAWSE